MSSNFSIFYVFIFRIIFGRTWYGTTVFDWYVVWYAVWWGSKIKNYKDTCLKEIMIGPKFEDERSQTRSVSFVKWEHVYLTCKIIKNMWRPNIMHVLTILCTAPRAGTGGGGWGGDGSSRQSQWGRPTKPRSQLWVNMSQLWATRGLKLGMQGDGSATELRGIMEVAMLGFDLTWV